MKAISKGTGFTVQMDFARAREDTPILEIASNEYARPGHVIAYIAGDPQHTLGFMRSKRVRCHVREQDIIEI